MLSRNWIQLRDDESSSECHILPCSIKYSGPVDKSKLEIQLSESPSARLRGRPLKGRNLNLSALGFSGFRLSPSLEKVEPEEENYSSASPKNLDEVEPTVIVATEMLQTGSPFKQIIVWEHGKVPNATDPWVGKLEELLSFARCMSS